MVCVDYAALMGWQPRYRAALVMLSAALFLGLSGAEAAPAATLFMGDSLTPVIAQGYRDVTGEAVTAEYVTGSGLSDPV